MNRNNQAGRYGLTPEQIDLLCHIQGDTCAICRVSLATVRVDHDHATGIARGLLCHPCNVGLGWFRDQPDLLRAAANYLEYDTVRIFGIVGGHGSADSITTAAKIGGSV